MVASAAPRTPICRAKMKIGSRMMLQIAPVRTVIMLILVKPCAVIKQFSAMEQVENSVPQTYRFMYSSAYGSVSLLAPKSTSSGSEMERTRTVSAMLIRISATVQLPRMRSAVGASCFPSEMEASGAPPAPMSWEKAVRIIMSGMHTPMPVRARLPTSGIWPM